MNEFVHNNDVKNIQFKEKETILVWLDFGPYSYINLGIISELNKLGKFDFVGIITTHQDMSFFQKQNFVQFKKLLYYPECYIGKSSFNINNLKKIEEKFNLKLWLDIFAERSFYKFWTDFHKFSREEILIIIENSILFYIDILEKFQPKAILMQQGGENVSNLIFYRIAKKMNIKILMPNGLHVKNRIHISNNLTSNEISEKFEKSKICFKDSERKFNKKFIEEDDHLGTLKTVASFDSSIATFSQKINHYIKRLTNDLEPTYNNIGKTKFGLIKYRFNNFFEVRKREKFLEGNSIKKINDKKFLYFPLQSEPESTVLAISPFYSNQISLIEMIAKSIPIDSVLYVKEHPIQKEKLWRSVGEYKKIIDIPNVKLLHHNINSLNLIEKSQGVITISGSTGFEALFLQKPVILFGDTHYDKLSMVTKITSINDLPKKIKSALINFKFNEKELDRLMEVIFKNSISIPYASIMKDGVSLSAIQRNGENFDLTDLHFKKYTEKYEEDFKIIANSVFSRIYETIQ